MVGLAEVAAGTRQVVVAAGHCQPAATALEHQTGAEAAAPLRSEQAPPSPVDRLCADGEQSPPMSAPGHPAGAPDEHTHAQVAAAVAFLVRVVINQHAASCRDPACADCAGRMAPERSISSSREFVPARIHTEGGLVGCVDCRRPAGPQEGHGVLICTAPGCGTDTPLRSVCGYCVQCLGSRHGYGADQLDKWFVCPACLPARKGPRTKHSTAMRRLEQGPTKRSRSTSPVRVVERTTSENCKVARSLKDGTGRFCSSLCNAEWVGKQRNGPRHDDITDPNMPAQAVERPESPDRASYRFLSLLEEDRGGVAGSANLPPQSRPADPAALGWSGRRVADMPMPLWVEHTKELTRRFAAEDGARPEDFGPFCAQFEVGPRDGMTIEVMRKRMTRRPQPQAVYHTGADFGASYASWTHQVLKPMDFELRMRDFILKMMESAVFWVRSVKPTAGCLRKVQKAGHCVFHIEWPLFWHVFTENRCILKDFG